MNISEENVMVYHPILHVAYIGYVSTLTYVDCFSCESFVED